VEIPFPGPAEIYPLFDGGAGPVKGAANESRFRALTNAIASCQLIINKLNDCQPVANIPCFIPATKRFVELARRPVRKDEIFL